MQKFHESLRHFTGYSSLNDLLLMEYIFTQDEAVGWSAAAQVDQWNLAEQSQVLQLEMSNNMYFCEWNIISIFVFFLKDLEK